MRVKMQQDEMLLVNPSQLYLKKKGKRLPFSGKSAVRVCV